MKHSGLARLSGITLVTAGVLTWGTVPVAIRPVAQKLAPHLIVFFRFAVASLFLLGSVMASRRGGWRGMAGSLRRNAPWLLLLVAVGFLIPQLCFTWALKKEFVGVVAFVVYSYPCFAMLIATFTLSERLSPRAIAALALLLAGLFFVVTGGNWSPASLAGRWTYVLAAFVVAVCWGASTVLSKHLLERDMEPSLLALARTSLGALLLLPPVLYETLSSPEQWLVLEGVDWVLLSYAGIVPIAVGLPLYLMGLAQTNVTRASFVEACTPMLAATLAVPLLGEQLTLTQWAGGALVMGATVTAGLVMKPEPHGQPAIPQRRRPDSLTNPLEERQPMGKRK